MSSKDIYKKDKKIEVFKQWLEPQSIWDMQVFFRFANFYWQFIQRFSQIAALLTLVLKTLRNIEFLRWPGEKRVGLGLGNSRAGCDERCKFDRSEIGGNEINGGEVKKDEFGKKV